MAQRLLFLQHCHMDPVWRRCFDRPATRDGYTMSPYSVVEAGQINRWLSLASKGYTFSEGQAAVWRKYLEKYPQNLPRLQQYAREGILDVMLAGETVQDSNMPTAEGLVRNFLIAMPFYRDFVGTDHPGLKLAWLEDAFGNSPNLPQILRGVGAEVACRLSYRRLEGEDVWVGIDGTAIKLLDNFPHKMTGAYAKLPPCHHCDGKGGDCCSGSGIEYLDDKFTPEDLADTIDAAAALDSEWSAALCFYEEFRPSEIIYNVYKEKAAEYAGRCEFVFANFTSLYQQMLPQLTASIAIRDDTPSPDLNPGMPGCYVTHIKNKQRVRDISYRLLCAEAEMANESWQKKLPTPPPEEINRAWQKVLFNHFHDAITGTHIDQANEELHEMLDEAEMIAEQHFPLRKNIGHAGIFHPTDGTKRTLQLGLLEVTIDLHGILAISCNGKDLFGTLAQTIASQRDFRLAELVLEDDWGDAWGMRKAHSGAPHADYSAMALGDWNDSLEIAEQGLRWRGAYRGSSERIKKLSWTITVTPSSDGRRLNFVTEIDWDTCSHRLRVYLPVASQDDTACYEVPFGFIERKYQPELLDYSEWNSNTMEFPALHWVNKRIDDERGVALFNKGLPCNRWAPGAFDLSLLRSPQMPFCSMPHGRRDVWDMDGWRDSGRHRFEFSVMPYTDRVGESELTHIGYQYNMPAPLSPPFEIIGDDVLVTAWKVAEDGSGWILRLQETAGNTSAVELLFGEERTITETNLLEEKTAAAICSISAHFNIHKHGILTLHIR